MKSLQQTYQDHVGKTSDKWSFYLDKYDELFDRRRGDEVSILEIGIQNGGSLEIWAKYFEHAKAIIGCDINPDCQQLTFADKRIHVVVDDANTDRAEQEITNICESLDIIIDDGSHTSSDIVRSFQRYFKRLKDGGIFIAEDLHCSYWQEFEGGIHAPFSSIAFFKRLADITGHEHWGTDLKRQGLLRGFSHTYEIEFDEELLSHIHSIEFANSLCIIRKAKPTANALGKRIIVGDESLVIPITPEIKSLSGKESISLDQRANEFALRPTPPEEELYQRLDELQQIHLHAQKLQTRISLLKNKNQQKTLEFQGRIKKLQYSSANLHSTLDSLDQQVGLLNSKLLEIESERAHLKQTLILKDQAIASILESTSWKLSTPIRIVGHQYHRLKWLSAILPKAINRSGGIASTTKKALAVLKKEGLYGLRAQLRRTSLSLQTDILGTDTTATPNDYSNWVKHQEALSEDIRENILEQIDLLPRKPKISIVTPTYNPKLEWLVEAIESVRQQSYSNWELCIADDASEDPLVRETLERYMREDTRVKVVFREQNGHISAASNSALEIATGDWIALLDHDDLLAKHALLEVVYVISKSPTAKLIYSDEDKLDSGGNRCLPFFKPDWSPHLACSQAYLGHLVVFNITDGKPKFDERAVGAQDYDLWLSISSKLKADEIVHIPKVLYHWRMHQESTASNPMSKNYADAAGLFAVNKFLSEKYGANSVSAISGDNLFTYKLDFKGSNSLRYSIIIPTKDKPDLLSTCINSIIEKSSCQNFEIIILDNNSTEIDTIQYFEHIQKSDSRVRVISAFFEFNWSKLNNLGASNASGDVLIFLNNDTSVISPNWLEQLGGYASLPDAGVVGALLLFADGSIQHSGVVVGMGGWADHVYHAQPAVHNGAGPFVSPVLTRNVLAVTGACMAMTRSKFDTLGGFDESFIICGSDVEICVRAAKQGFNNIMCADACLYHFESKTRSPHVPENDFEQSILKYAPYRTELIDPYFSPNLSLQFKNPRIESHPRAS